MARRPVKKRKHEPQMARGIAEAATSALIERNLPALSRSMTFGRMVQDNAVFRAALRDLRWLFPPICRRKDQATARSAR